MADIETRLRRLLKVNTAVLGHLHVRSVLARLAASALELTGVRFAAVRTLDADGSVTGIIGPADAAAVTAIPPFADAVEVPVDVHGTIVAELVVADHPGGALAADDIELLHALTATAGVAIDKARRYEATRQRERWAQATADVRAATTTTDALAAVAAALPALTDAAFLGRAVADASGGVRVSGDEAERTDGGPRSWTMALPAATPLAFAVRGDRVGILPALSGGTPSRTFGQTLVVPISPGRRPTQGRVESFVISRAAGAVPLAAREIDRVEALVAEAAAIGAPLAPADETDLDAYRALTPREREMVGLIADGLTNKQIGTRLHLSEKTVKNNVTALLHKLGMERRTQVAAFAVRLRGSL